MSPKTLLDNQSNQGEQPREEQNQTSTNENGQNDLNMANNQKSDDVILNLGSNLKDNLIGHFSKFTTLLRGVLMSADDKKKLIEMNSDLFHRLSFLSFDDYENTMRDNLNSIDKNLMVNLTRDEHGLYYELESTTRSDIVNLLMRNMSSLWLLNIRVSDEDKANLIKQNNDLAHRLLDLKSKPICGDLNAVKHREIEDETEESDNPPSNKIRNGELTDLKEKLESYEELLESNIRAIDVRSNETTFYFNIDAEPFLKAKKEVLSACFFCSSIQWFLSAKSNYEEDGKKWVEFFLNLKVEGSFNWIVKANYQLRIVHSTNSNISRSGPISTQLFRNGAFSSWGVYKFITHDDLVDFIGDNKIKLGVYLRVEDVTIQSN